MGTSQYKCQSLFLFVCLFVFLFMAWICIRILFNNLGTKCKDVNPLFSHIFFTRACPTFCSPTQHLTDLNPDGGSSLLLSLSSLIQRALKETSTKGKINSRLCETSFSFTLSAPQNCFSLQYLKNLPTYGSLFPMSITSS